MVYFLESFLSVILSLASIIFLWLDMNWWSDFRFERLDLTFWLTWLIFVLFYFYLDVSKWIAFWMFFCSCWLVVSLLTYWVFNRVWLFVKGLLLTFLWLFLIAVIGSLLKCLSTFGGFWLPTVFFDSFVLLVFLEFFYLGVTGPSLFYSEDYVRTLRKGPF
jgi:hypothetical protein